MSVWRRSAVCLGALATAACNVISGADAIEFDPNFVPGAGEGTGNGTSTGSGTGGATSGGTPSTSTGSGQDQTLVPADGVTMTEIKLYQGLERPIMKNGKPVGSDIPLIAGRDAFLRVFYSAPTAGDVTLRVSFGSGDPIEKSTQVSGTSSQDALASTVNVMIPGDRLGSGAGIRVELLRPASQSSGGNATAVFPAAGVASLPLESAGSTLKIVLVPIQYNADGSKRLPDTTDAQLQRYRDAFFRMYPTPSVTLTVKPPVAWNQVVSPSGSGWDSLLNAIADYRQKSGAAKDDYYYGVFNAASSFGAFCSSGCVAGLSLLAGPNDPMSRAGIGIGFTGEDAAGTAAHEIGHQHGRPHAPCGVSQSVDPFFPHKDGSIGTVGFDLVSKKLIPPSQADFMSYCHPEWVSDYNYKQLFQRIKLVNNASWLGDDDVVYERVAIAADGTASWLGPTTNGASPSGETTALDVETESGPQKLEGYFYPYSHVGGGVLLVPRTKATLRAVAFDWAGARIELPR